MPPVPRTESNSADSSPPGILVDGSVSVDAGVVASVEMYWIVLGRESVTTRLVTVWPAATVTSSV